jgi:hypothetical protein
LLKAFHDFMENMNACWWWHANWTRSWTFFEFSFLCHDQPFIQYNARLDHGNVLAKSTSSETSTSSFFDENRKDFVIQLARSANRGVTLPVTADCVWIGRGCCHGLICHNFDHKKRGPVKFAPKNKTKEEIPPWRVWRVQARADGKWHKFTWHYFWSIVMAESKTKTCHFCGKDATDAKTTGWAVCSMCKPPSKRDAVTLHFPGGAGCSFCGKDGLFSAHVSMSDWAGVACDTCYAQFAPIYPKAPEK